MKKETCNKELIGEVADETGVEKKVIRGIIDHYGKFTAQMIVEGSLEGVIFPYLGKIQVKHKGVVFVDFVRALTPEMRKVVRSTNIFNPEE